MQNQSILFLHCCPLSIVLDQFVWISSATEGGRDLFLSPRFLHHYHTSCSLDLWLPVFSLTAGRYLSAVFLSVSADIVLPLVPILIYQLSFIRPHHTIILTQPWHHGHRSGNGGWESGRVGRTEKKMINAVSFRRCISAECARFSACIWAFNVAFCCLQARGRNFSSRCGSSCMNGWCAPQRTYNHKPHTHLQTLRSSLSLSVPLFVTCTHTPALVITAWKWPKKKKPKKQLH